MNHATAPSEGSTASLLIDVAQELVQSRGYNGFSYRDISARVGIKTSSIHYHFPAKSDLVLALVARYRTRFSARLDEVAAQNPVPVARLEKYLQLICASYSSSSLICLCGMLATDAASLPPEIITEIRGFFADNEGFLSPLLAQGREESQFHFQGPPQEVAASLFATMQGAMLSAYTFGEENRVTDAAAWIKTALHIAV